MPPDRPFEAPRSCVSGSSVKAFYDPSAQFGLQFGKPGAANDSARQHMASAMPDVVGVKGEETRVLEAESEEDSESDSVEVVMSRPPAEVVQLDNFRKK